MSDVAPSYKYGRTHLETRISEEYAEGRYTSKYPKHRYAMHGTMERDAYRRIKYGHSYQERAHRTCPDCKLCGQNYNYPNGEEFSAISGCQEAYYQTVSAKVRLLVFCCDWLDVCCCCFCFLLGPWSDSFNFSSSISLWGFLLQGGYK
jgi:hypothetical protein